MASIVLSTGLLLGSPAARAQLAVPTSTPAARGYDFLTVTTVEGNKAQSYLLFSTPFQGKTEVPLTSIMLMGAEKYKEAIIQNTQLINEQLTALTVAGWELAQVYVVATPINGRAYLFRKAKN
ncbi:MAG: hypothetical protein EOO56_20415 [Hymenobacter sp.]|nr:MAG: hypothetical protein EOO56_20415 [Hymenobacter sp.]